VAQDRQDKDIISQLADRGQEALGKIGDLNLPGGQKLVQIGRASCRERV